MNLRDIISAADDKKIEAVEIAEWGCTVYVHSLDGAGRARFEMLCAGHEKDIAGARIVERLLVCTLYDADGDLIFDMTEDDIAALSKKNSAPLLRLFKVARQLNGIGGDAVEKAKQDF